MHRAIGKGRHTLSTWGIMSYDMLILSHMGRPHTLLLAYEIQTYEISAESHSGLTPI